MYKEDKLSKIKEYLEKRSDELWELLPDADKDDKTEMELVNTGRYMELEQFEWFLEKLEKEETCKDCWHNYHCPMSQEGYNFNPATCPYNPDNEKLNKEKKTDYD